MNKQLVNKAYAFALFALVLGALLAGYHMKMEHEYQMDLLKAARAALGGE